MNQVYGKALRQFATQYGVPFNVAQALIRAESGGNPNAVSPVGAKGLGQLMPGTARSLGVNIDDPIDNLRGSMMYLGRLIKSFHGNLRYAVAAYNAGPAAVSRYGGIPPYKETQDYVKRVFAMAGPGQNNQQFTQNRLNAVNTLPGQRPQVGALSPQLSDALQLAAPSEAAQSILGRLGGTAGRAAEAASAPIPLPASQTPGGQGIPLPGTNTLQPMPEAVGQGGYVVSPGANRAGVKLQPDILGFVSDLSGLWGKKLRIGTGTNHNQFVKGTHNESDHWTGHAVDIPAKGATLIRLGQTALIAAGADPAWARKQKGGVFNINGHNILFMTQVGGDHTNHLHVGMGH